MTKIYSAVDRGDCQVFSSEMNISDTISCRKE